MKVCVVGGGNLGTLLISELSSNGYDTFLYTKNSAQWDQDICVYDKMDRELLSSKGFEVTDRLDYAISNADYIWITYPAFLFDDLAKALLPIIKKGQVLVCIPGSGGAEFAFSSLIKKGVVLSGLQRVHCITRIKEPRKSVYALGRKPSVSLGSFPAEKATYLALDISNMLSMPCFPLPNYLCVTLSPSNPILHTSRLYTMFKDYHKGLFYDHNILFYEEWTDEASECLILCDNELQLICSCLGHYDLSSVVSLRDYYESYSALEMTKKISGIQAFKGISSPMVMTEKGWIPDFNSRYFKADFSYGLKVLVDIAGKLGCPVPTMCEIWDWYVSISDSKDYFHLNNLDWDILGYC